MEVKNVISKIAALTIIAILLTTCFIIAAAIIMFTVTIPSGGNLQKAGVTVTWLNGTEVSYMNWSGIENATETPYPELIKVTNNGTIPITLTLNRTNISSNILALSLSWNYTGTILNPSNFAIVQLYLTAEVADLEPFTFYTAISAEAP
jgi:hypothetical protein